MTWNGILCDKITFASSSKEMREGFNNLTIYQVYIKAGVLPLLDDTGKALFDNG